jgi:3-phenylpropionate/cinnamic acid dioxygenase small subunit
MMTITREYAEFEADARQFLNREALLLDSGDLEGWLGILAPDISYRVPVRTTRYGRPEDEFSPIAAHFDEDMFTLTMRVKRLGTRYAWAEDPPSRSRHLVSNIIVTGVSDWPEFEVASSLLLLRTRFDDGRTESLSSPPPTRSAGSAEGWNWPVGWCTSIRRRSPWGASPRSCD